MDSEKSVIPYEIIEGNFTTFPIIPSTKHLHPAKGKFLTYQPLALRQFTQYRYKHPRSDKYQQRT